MTGIDIISQIITCVTTYACVREICMLFLRVIETIEATAAAREKE